MNHQESPDLRLTTDLLRQAKDGDPAAMQVLMSRYLPRLKRWASGRLPLSARSLFDTTDLVHETLLKAIQGLDGIEVLEQGGFQAYIRQGILNCIRDQMRWAARRSGSEPVSDALLDRRPSPLEDAIGAELIERYEGAREQLSDEEKLLVHLRIELDFGYEEIAAITGRPSRDAARMAVQRAVRKLAGILGQHR